MFFYQCRVNRLDLPWCCPHTFVHIFSLVDRGVFTHPPIENLSSYFRVSLNFFIYILSQCSAEVISYAYAFPKASMLANCTYSIPSGEKGPAPIAGDVAASARFEVCMGNSILSSIIHACSSERPPAREVVPQRPLSLARLHFTKHTQISTRSLAVFFLTYLHPLFAVQCTLPATCFLLKALCR